MRAIILVCSPEETTKILNGDKSLLIRKLKPNCELPIDVYIYCTKDSEKALVKTFNQGYQETRVYDEIWKENHIKLNGKVVAKFTLNKVEEIKPTDIYETFSTNPFDTQIQETCEWCKKSCLTFSELDNYLNGNKGYGWHITKLEIFDKPKEISEFHKVDKSWGFICYNCPHFCTDDSAGYSIDSCELGFGNCEKTRLTRAPQSWCYIEV